MEMSWKYTKYICPWNSISSKRTVKFFLLITPYVQSTQGYQKPQFYYSLLLCAYNFLVKYIFFYKT